MHNILLISRLLNQREGASPFTLVLDTLEQPAKPLIKEYIRRANVGPEPPANHVPLMFLVVKESHRLPWF